MQTRSGLIIMNRMSSVFPNAAGIAKIISNYLELIVKAKSEIESSLFTLA